MLDGDDLRLERGVGRALEAGRDPGDEDHGEDARAVPKRAGSSDSSGERQDRRRHDELADDVDRASVAAVGEMAAEQRQGQGGQGLDQTEQAERQRVARSAGSLVTDDDGQRAHHEPRGEADDEQRLEVAQPNDGWDARANHERSRLWDTVERRARGEDPV